MKNLGGVRVGKILTTWMVGILMTVSSWAGMDGGGSAIISPNAPVSVSMVGTWAVVFTVPQDGMAAGGGIRLDVPMNWTAPNIALSGATPGYVRPINSAGSGYTINVTGQSIYISFPNALPANTTIALTYGSAWQSASGRAQAPSYPSSWNSFRVYSDLDGLPGSDTGLGMGGGKSYTQVWSANLNIPVTGPMTSVRFNSYNQTVLKDNILGLILQTSDDGGNPSGAATSNIVVTLTAWPVNPTTNFRSQTPATTVTFYSDQAGTSVVNSATILSGTSSVTFYIKDTTAEKLQIDAQSTINNQQRYSGTNVVVLNSGISNPSIDTGVLGSLTNVTITPDRDGTDDFAFVNFTLEQESDWVVVFDTNRDGTFTISNTPGTYSDYQRGGRGTSNRVQFDGFGTRTDGSWGPFGNGVYAVKVMVGSWQWDSLSNQNNFNASFSDTSLTLKISSGAISGTVRDDSGNLLANVQVGAFGMRGGSQVMSASNGTYTIDGLGAGSYGIQARKAGYAEANGQQIAVTAGTTTTVNLTLAKGSTLRVVAVRPTGSYNFDVFGGVNAHPSQPTQGGGFGAYGNVHFPTGSATLSDNGWYNKSDTLNFKNYTELGLAAGTYNVRIERLSGLGTNNWIFTTDAGGSLASGSGDSATVVLTAGQTGLIHFTLTRRAGINGTIILTGGQSAGGNSNYGTHIGVEAFLASNPNDFTNRYWGGAWFNNSTGTQNFEISGVSPGTYSVKVRREGFVEYTYPTNIVVGASTATPSSITITSADFSRGASITGVFALANGATLSQGQSYIWLNVWSRNGYGRGTQIQLSGSSANYIVGGLQPNTTYEMNTFVNGFEMDMFANGTRSVTTTSAEVAQNITLRAYTGVISGEVKFTGRQAGEVSNTYQRVKVFATPMQGPGMMGGGSSGSSNFANMTSSLTYDGTKYTYAINGLGTSAYNVVAMYQFDPASPTTAYPFKNAVVRVVNGVTTTQDFDLGGTSRKIVGKVVTTSTNSRWNTIANITANATKETSYGGGQGKSVFRVVALPINEQGEGGGFGSDFGGGNSGGLGFFADINASTLGATIGEFTLFNLPDGAYKLFVPGKLSLSSGGSQGGPGGNYQAPDVVSTAPIIIINGADVTDANISIGDGYKIAGTVSLPSGTSDTVYGQVNVWKRNSYGGSSPYAMLTFASGAAQQFSFEKQSPGEYTVQVFSDKFANGAKSVQIVASDVTDANIQLKKGASVKVKLKDADSSTVITSDNEGQFLGGLRIYVQANPWVEGGYKEARDFQTGKYVGSDGYITIKNVPAGSYDFIVETNSYSFDQSTTKNYAPIQKGGINISDDDVTSNVTKDLGILDLTRGEQITGTVTEKSTGAKLANILVVAFPSNKGGYSTSSTARTDKNGVFTLPGLNKSMKYHTVIASPRGRFGGQDLLFTGDKYGEIRKDDIDITVTKSGIDFAMTKATSKVSGTVVVTDGGTLYPGTPFDSGDGGTKIGAEVFLQNKENASSSDDPLGDIHVLTKPDGTFFVDGLVPGTYALRVLAKGYASYGGNVSVAASATASVGTITLTKGGKVSGTIAKPDGTQPNTNEAQGVAAVTNDFGEILFATVTSDSNTKLVSAYEMDGLKPNVPYNMIIFPSSNSGGAPDNMIYGGSITLTAVGQSSTKNLLYQPTGPRFIVRFAKSGNAYVLKFFSTQSLRNQTTDDQDATKIVTVKSGTGTISGQEVSADRRTVSATYTPGTGETKFVINVTAYSTVKDVTTNQNFQANQDFSFLAGVDAQAVENVSIALGGSAKIEGEATQLFFLAGSFEGTLSGTVPVTLANVATDASGAPRFGASAYSKESWDLFRKSAAHAPLVAQYAKSGFFDIGLGQTLKAGKTYKFQAAVSKSKTVTDYTKLNVYYFNPVTGAYEIEKTTRKVDPDNGTVTVELNHASRFVIMESEAATIGGESYTGTTFEVFNYPNPFDLSAKTVNLSKSSTTTAAIAGTMIRYALPSTMTTGDVTFTFYNLAGEKVRTITETSKAGGSYYYKEWDGKNDDGTAVASGVYICIAKAPGATKTFKLAVVK